MSRGSWIRETILVLGVFLLHTTAFAAQEEPVSVKADQVEYFDAFRKVVASGSVVATYKEAKLTCDQATIYMDTKDAYLKGRVRLFQGDGLLKGEEILYNFETRKGTILLSEGQVEPWRSKGDRAYEVSSTAFVHRGRSSVTSCDFEQPHTRLQAKEVQVFLDDKLVLKNVVTYVGNIPVFYLPSYTYPLDDKRPRVTIIPGKDKDWGLFVLTSWRLYLTENIQGQVHVDYRERKDLASGVDLRYELPEGGEGILRTYYTNERDIYTKHLWSPLIHPEKESAPTTERERFRVQVRHRWEIDRQTRATLEYHVLKDPTVVKDFFLQEFQRDQGPRTYFQVVRSDPWYGLNFLVTKRVNRFETVTQQLPQVTLDIRPLRIPWLPVVTSRVMETPVFPERSDTNQPQQNRALPHPGTSQPGWYYRSSWDYVHFNQAGQTQGTKNSLVRFDVFQELFYTMQALNWLNFRPFAGIRQTLYSRGAVQNSLLERGAFSTGFDLSSRLFRVFEVDTNLLGMEIHRLRHLITPTLQYRYDAKPTLSADRFLQYDGIDGLTKANLLTPGIEHKLQTKRQEGTGWKAVDLARFLTTVSYDLEGPSGRGGRWNNIGLDMEAKPYRSLYVESDASVDPHIGKFTTITADLVAAPGASKGLNGPTIGQVYDESGKLQELPWAVGLGWRYQRKTSAQLTLETDFDLGKKWRLGMTQGFDVKRFVSETTNTGSRTVKKIYDPAEFEYRIRRDLHEWTGEILFGHRRDQGQTVLLVFRLKALPDEPVEFQRGYNLPKAGRNFPKR